MIVVVFIAQCSKSETNFSNIYMTDSAGQLINGTTDDGQWKSKEFSSSEMNLFAELDTADLSGTTMASISQSYFAYPNPFKYQIAVGCSLAQPLNGQVVIKYVIANAGMKAVQKGVIKADVVSTINFLIAANFNSGNYRLYYTFSAEGHEHFFKTWGNIQKSP
jgi:hypothetical protein